MKKLGSPPDSRNQSDDGDISDASPPRRPRPIALQSSREQLPSGEVSDASPPRRRPSAVPRQNPWDQCPPIGDAALPHRMNDALERTSRLPLPPMLQGVPPPSTMPASHQEYEIAPQLSEKRQAIEHNNGVEQGGLAWLQNPGIAHPSDGVSARSNAKIGRAAALSSLAPSSGAAAEDPLLGRWQVEQRLSFNRYNILAGPRWDGIDRSNGFEMGIEKMKAERNEADHSAYKASVSDM